MRLALSFPRNWVLRESADGSRTAVRPDADGKPAIVAEWGPLVLLPDDQNAWLAQMLRRGLPVDARIERGPLHDRTSETGWPIRVVDGSARAPDGRGSEHRVCVFYAFLEHGAAVTFRAAERATLDAHGPEILAVLASGRPDWQRREQASCLATTWNLELPASRPHVEAGAVADLAHTLHETDTRLTDAPTAALHLARGQILDRLGRADEALLAYRAAAALAPELAPARFLAGGALATFGRIDEAVVDWEATVELDPRHLDAHRNLGRAHHERKRHERALASWRAVLALDPGDFLVHRDIVQSLYALGRNADGLAARRTLHRVWRETPDRRARLIREYVFDRFSVARGSMQAVEIVHPRDPRYHSIVELRAFDAHDQPLALSLVVETGEHARQTETPLVVARIRDGEYEPIATWKTMPPYADLKGIATALLTEVWPAGD